MTNSKNDTCLLRIDRRAFRRWKWIRKGGMSIISWKEREFLQNLLRISGEKIYVWEKEKQTNPS
jgi:hypothetical protein